MLHLELSLNFSHGKTDTIEGIVSRCETNLESFGYARDKEQSTRFETVESVDILLKQIPDLKCSMLFTSISVSQC